MVVLAKDAYIAAEEACSGILVQKGTPEYSIDALISFPNGVDIAEYVMYVQGVVGMFACLDCPTCSCGVDDVFYVEFVSTRTPEFVRFVVRFPIVESNVLDGKRYGFGEKTFSDLSEFAYYGPKWELHTNMPNGDFSSFERLV